MVRHKFGHGSSLNRYVRPNPSMEYLYGRLTSQDVGQQVLNCLLSRVMTRQQDLYEGYCLRSEPVCTPQSQYGIPLRPADQSRRGSTGFELSSVQSNDQAAGLVRGLLPLLLSIRETYPRSLNGADATYAVAPWFFA